MRLFLNILVGAGVLCLSQHATAGHLSVPLGLDHANLPAPAYLHVDHPDDVPHSHPHSSPLHGPSDHHDADDHEHGFSVTRCNAYHQSHVLALALRFESLHEPIDVAPATAADLPAAKVPLPPDSLFLKVCSLLL